MGTEIMKEAEAQNEQIGRVTDKAEHNKNRIDADVQEGQAILTREQKRTGCINCSIQ